MEKKIAVCYLDSSESGNTKNPKKRKPLGQELRSVINAIIRYYKYKKDIADTKIEIIDMRKGIHENFNIESWHKRYRHTLIIENGFHNKISGYTYFLEYKFNCFNMHTKGGAELEETISYEIFLISNCFIYCCQSSEYEAINLSEAGIFNIITTAPDAVRDYDFSHPQ